MKKIIYMITGVAICLFLGCRLDRLEVDCGEHKTFERKYNISSNFAAYDIAETTDGGYVMCGEVYHTNDLDIFLMKIDKSGEIIFFETERKETTNEICHSIVTTPDKGFLVCGSAENKAYFAKYNFEGKRLGDERVELFNCSSCESINKSGNEYVFAGTASNPEIKNSYVGTLNLQGQTPTLITHYLPNPRSDTERVQEVILSRGAYTVVGYSYNTPGNAAGAAMHFYRLNENLQIIPNTEKLYHLGTQQDIAKGVAETEDGNYLIVGNLHTENGGRNIFVVKANPNGEILNQYEYGGSLNEGGYSITQAHQSSQYMILGEQERSETDRSNDIYLAKIKSDGSIIWEKTFGDAGINESGLQVIPTECNGYIVTGYSENIGGERQVYTIKIDANGNVF